jgi:hypothetical protein
MKSLTSTALAALISPATAADPLTTRNPNPAAPAAAVGTAFNAAKELPRFLPVEPAAALATWKVKRGFKLPLAALKPQIRDPIALTFDENGRRFVCEKIDRSCPRSLTMTYRAKPPLWLSV